MKIMHKTLVSMADTQQSIRDLVRVYKVPSSKVNSFITWFIKRYKVECSSRLEEEFREIAYKEIEKLEEKI